MSASLRRTALAAVGVLLILATLAFSNDAVRGFGSYAWGTVRGGYSVAERLDQYKVPVAFRLRRDFERVGLQYPPHELAYVSFKDSRVLEVYGRMSSSQAWRFVRQYTVLGASGQLGPKLAEGDNQVPEGLYRVEYLNPNSRFHLSIRLNYPNEFDKRMAAADRRTRLGSDIMIHGGSLSIGCLAVGDRAAEDLFVLAALVSKERVRVLISPTDFRTHANPGLVTEPAWVRGLYADIRSELQQFRKGPHQVSASRLELQR